MSRSLLKQVTPFFFLQTLTSIKTSIKTRNTNIRTTRRIRNGIDWSMATGMVCASRLVLNARSHLSPDVVDKIYMMTVVLFSIKWWKPRPCWNNSFFVLCSLSLNSSDHKDSSDKKHRDKEKMKHKDGSTDKYKDKHKEKRKEEKVNYYADNSWQRAHVVVHLLLFLLCNS